MDIIIKIGGTCEMKYKDCECFLENINVKDNSIEYKC